MANTDIFTPFPVELKDGEKAEPLGDGHIIIQSANKYRFGKAAVSLAHFAAERIKKTDSVLDMCSGCGVIGIMLAIERGCAVTGVEIDAELCDMGVRAAKANGLSDVRFINADIATCAELKPRSFDCVVCNPPFFSSTSKQRGISPQAGSELTVTLETVISTSERVLKQNGTLYMVNSTSRIADVLSECRAVKLEPKSVAVDPDGKTFLMCAVRGAKRGLAFSIKSY